MRALSSEERRLDIESRPVPVPAPSQYGVSIALLGFVVRCTHLSRPQPFRETSRVIGHEFDGTTDAVGEQVSPGTHSASVSR